MAEDTKKQVLPPYISYKTFDNFINGLRETGVPHQIDKSVLRTMSGAVQSATIASFKFLGLIDERANTTKKLTQLVDATGDNYSTSLKNVLLESYGFLFKDGLNIEQATGMQVENKFKEQGVSGSTTTKCVAFFLAAAKEAKIKVSSHIRPPSIVRSGGQTKSNKSSIMARKKFLSEEDRAKKYQTTTPTPASENENDLPGERSGYMRITIPLHGVGDGAIFLPDGLSPYQRAYALKITKFLLDNYWLDDETQNAIDQIEGGEK